MTVTITEIDERDRKLVYELIDASLELAAKKGPHPLEPGCNCITCVNRRKRLINKEERIWKYEI